MIFRMPQPVTPRTESRADMDELELNMALALARGSTCERTMERLITWIPAFSEFLPGVIARA